ncbi:uncharacterized protein TNCV_1368831 [Trichonephila clavipes]|nr:uncharacterized protein TNCV_1368831 [Trichonephila clavipes]
MNKAIKSLQNTLGAAALTQWSWSRTCGQRVMSSSRSATEGSPSITKDHYDVAAVAEWSRYHWIAAGLVTSSSPVPLKTHRVGQRCTLNLSRAETSSRWCGAVVRRGIASSGVIHVT